MSLPVALLAVSLAAGLVVLGVLGWRLFGQVRSLARTVGSNAERLAAAAERLPDAAPDAHRDTYER